MTTLLYLPVRPSISGWDQTDETSENSKQLAVKAAALKLDAALLRLDLANDRTPEETLLIPRSIVAGALGDRVTYETMIERLRDSGVPPCTVSKHIFSEIQKVSFIGGCAQ